MTPRNVKSDSRLYNSLKLRALEVFEERDWMEPPTWAVFARFYPVRAAYTYLLRLHRYGLLQRRRGARGRLLYRISVQGRKRLAWLRRAHLIGAQFSR